MLQHRNLKTVLFCILGAVVIFKLIELLISLNESPASQTDDLMKILIYIFVAWVIIRLIEWRVSKNASPIKKALNSFTAGLVMMGILVYALFLNLPHTYGLESYGYPEEFKSLEEVHKYLRTHNRILAGLREIIFWFLFFFAINFLPTLHSFAKTVAEINGGGEPRNN